MTWATEAKRGAAEGREGATDYGAVPDDAPVFRGWLATGQIGGARLAPRRCWLVLGLCSFWRAHVARRCSSWPAHDAGRCSSWPAHDAGLCSSWRAHDARRSSSAAAVGLSPSLALLLPVGGCGESIAVVVPVKEEKNRKPLRVRTFLSVRPSILAAQGVSLRSSCNGCMDRRVRQLLGGACSCGSYYTIRAKRHRFSEGGQV